MPDVDFDLSPAPATAEPNPTVPNQLTSPTSNTPAPATPATTTVDHTPGGLPAIPLAVITSNTTIGALSAAAIVGGPLAVAGVLGTIGAVAVGSAVATRSKSRRSTARQSARTGGGTTSRTGGRTGSGSRSTGGSAARTGAAGARKTATGATSGRTGGATKTPTRTGSGGGSKSAGAGGRNGSRTGGGVGTGGGKQGRAAQIKALRKDRRDAAPTRKEQRGKDTADRRMLRDARRAAKDGGLNLSKKNKNKSKNAPKHGANDPAAAGGNKLKNNRGGKTSTLGKPTNGTQPGAAGPSVKGQAADTLHKPMVKASRRDRLRNWGRAQRDQLAASRTERIQRARRNAKARWRLSRRCTGSGMRFAARWTAAALLAAPVGLLGCLTTPFGRKIGVASLMYPGRRLFWRLVGRAKGAHQARMAAARAEYDAAAAAAASTAPVDPLGETVPRAPQSATAPTTGEPDVSEVLKFLFEESAAEMEAAAQAYEPGGMMHVYQTIQGMPAGIESWANTFKILAEKSDDSFPLEPEVGEALSDVFDLLRKAATAAEEVRQVFEKAHEHDIERLTAPRISLEAEKTWDAGANEEYL